MSILSLCHYIISYTFQNKQLMKTSSDPSEVTQRLRQQLQLRCGKTGNRTCDNYLTELFLNIFHTIKGQLPKSDRRKQITCDKRHYFFKKIRNKSSLSKFLHRIF